MNKIKIFLWMLLVLLGSISASAQTSNKLSISTIPSPIGKEILVPVQMENTDEIVAVQFDIIVPEEITIFNEAVSTNRWENHIAVVKSLGNGRSRVMVYSSSNKSFKGNSGNVLLLKARTSESCVEGEEYPVNFEEIVLTKSNGENCVTGKSDGKFVILKSPDLTPEWISANKTSVNPTDTIQCSWRVKNIGGLPTTGGWKEQVFAVSEDGKYQVLLGSQYCENTIPSQGETVRSLGISLPEIPGIDGKCSLMIKIVPDANCGEPISMTGNNSCQSNQLINITKRLYLEDIKQAIDESNSPPLKYKLTRSGSTLQNETFTINVKHPDSRVTLPATVEIPRNQSSAYFYVTLAANGKLDESDNVEFSIVGNEYPEASSVLSIIDDTFPKLNVLLSKEEVKEGESFTLTIELPRTLSHDKTIFLSSDNSAKIKVPSDIVIPAGQTTVSVPLTVIDNDDAELETTVTIRATADGLDGKDCEIIALDDDMPTLSLTFSPSEVSENAGVSAVIATVRRLTNVDKNVKLLLFDDSKGAIELSHKTLSMGKGMESVQFIIDIKDNDIVDGDKRYNVTAAVYSSACDCYASELSGGLVSQALTVLDDDGPHLSISSASQAFLEGSSDNVITISRNTNTDSDITVNISSDKDDLLDYNHTVVIPAGTTSADVKVSVLSNETSGDGDIVSFKAESADMAAGSCWIVLTDQTLPDATIQMEVAQESPLAGECVDLILTISNIGNAPLQRNTPIDISCTGIKGSKRVYTKKIIEKGANDRLVMEDFQLPEKTGLVIISAVINDNERVTELLYSNNNAKAVELMLSPAFEVTASVNKNVYRQEEEVIISGHATGDAGKNTKIEIHLSNNGVEQTINATTDDNGDYEYKYKLLSRQTGHFTVSACYPTSTPSEAVAEFDVYGLQISKAFITCEPGLGETFNGSFSLSNPGNLFQTSLSIEKISTPDNCELTFKTPSKIDAGETVDVNFSLKGTALSSGKDFEKIPLVITTAEGAKTTFTVYYYIQSLHGKLYTSMPSISTTMFKDTPRDYPLVIRNIGKGETGKITFALPSWVETATPREMASLVAGDSATVMLRFQPMDEMKLNVATKGKLGVNCSNGDGISVSFDIMPVSEAIGKLKVDVVDEYTFYTAEAPHVSNAYVKISHPTSKEMIAEGRTGQDGIFTAEMNEGWYVMTVEADNHDTYTENIIISPGTELAKEVFMPYQAITYNWTVEETEIEDEYVFETKVDFDTRVPKPVIVISLPDEKPEPYSVIPVKITNKGLINAVNIEMSLEVSEGYTLEFLNDPTAEVLAPQQTLTFYAKLVPTESSADLRAKAPRADKECIWIISKAKYQELCQKYTGDQFVRMLKKYGKKSCFNSGSGSGGSGGHGGGYGGSGGVGRPGCWGGGSSYGSDYYVIDWSNPEKYCDRKPDSDPLDGDDNDPIDRPKVDDGNPEELPCDSKEEPKLVYKLVPVRGERYEMNGVAADGVSQVKIVLDPNQSSIPSQDCDKFYGFSWILLKDGEVVEDHARFGSIERISDWEAIYTAPSYFTEKDGSVSTIEAQLIYRHKDPTLPDDYEGWRREAPIVKIEIVRPPIVFIHGLGSSNKCWEKTDTYLTQMGLYPKGYNYRVDYEETNTSTFMNNVGVVADGIYVAQKQALTQGYVATKCDLIGHSMGGILARLYVDRGGKSGYVNRIITVNTPHAGSELGDMVTVHRILLEPIARWLYHSANIDAVKDLGVESEETSLLLNLSSHSDIPVYAFGTESALRDIILLGGSGALTVINGLLLASDVTTIAGAIADPEPISKTVLATTAALLTVAIVTNETQHLLLDDYNQIGSGDLVVSSESQQGGCNASEIMKNGPWHCNSPQDYKVMKRIKELLVTPPSDPTFSTDWFSPKKRHFKHNEEEIWRNRFINIIPVEGSEISYLQNISFGLEIILRNVFHAKGKTVASKAQERVVNMNLSLPEELSYILAAVYLNGELAYLLCDDETEYTIPSTFSGEVTVKALMKDAEDNLYYDEKSLTIEETLAKPVSIEAENMFVMVGQTSQLNIVCEWDDETQTFVTADNVEFEENDIARYYDGKIKGIGIGMTKAVISYAGLTCNSEVRVFPSNSIDDMDDSDAICSTVSLSFKQSAVMTRQAFRGIFSLNNGHQTATLRDFKLNLEVKDEDGIVATRREFEITPEKLAGFQGNLDFNSGWSLEPSHNGEASILFIPTKYAAPTEPKEYSFGGTFSYIDPYTGRTVTRTLNPVTLTVTPSPQLELTYFMQRDVFGDDPLTEDVEPMKPAEFALLLNNIGAGDATSLKLTTGQPQIVSNEKGLYINFELISSQLNGGEHSMMLGGSSVTDFGSLKAGEQSYAQWWLQSSLLGHFVKYDVKATHVTSHDNPNLSMVDTVTIHELIHGFDLIDNDVKRRAFLVNDIADVLDTPDQLYLSDGTQADVAIASDATISKQNDLEYILNVSASVPGWNYGSIADPTNGRQMLSSIRRMSDGADLAIDNFWQTDRTLRDGKDPLAENLLHFIDNYSTGNVSYRLTFTPKPDIELAVDSVIGLPTEDNILAEQLKAVTVRFNKSIDPATFTIEDLSLSCQGTKIELQGVTIEPKNDAEYLIDLSTATLENGFYVLSIQTSTISDTDGFAGTSGKQVSWIQYVDGKVKLTTSASPAEGGEVTPKTDLYDYDSTVTLEAIPAEGYHFLSWWSEDEEISDKPTFEAVLNEDKTYMARFALQQFRATVDCNSEGGYVEGTATGIYDYGYAAHLEAIPNYGWSFSHWTVDGSDIADGTNILELTIDHDTDVYATFVSNIKELTIPLHYGWNWISSVYDDNNLRTPMQFFKSIRSSLDEVKSNNGDIVVTDGNFDGSIERIIPGMYKLKVNNSTSLRLNGATVSEDTYAVSLMQGWNWLPYLPETEQSIIEALVNLSAQENDILKSHSQFAVFSDGRWIGSLKSLVPNEGYMYYANEPTSFKYSSLGISSLSEPEGNNTPWQHDKHGSADNKTIIANINDNGMPVASDDYIVGAFCGDECRGISENVEGKLFLTVHGRQGDDISFKAFNSNSSEIRTIKESISFDENSLGSYNLPYILNLDTSSGINEALAAYGLKITPNPVKDIMYVEGNLSDVKTVKIIGTSGLTLISTDNFEHGVNVSSLPNGVYLVAVVTSNGVMYEKILKKGY